MKDFQIVGPADSQQSLDVEPCFLPFVVLFSIAAQDNAGSRGAVRRPVRGYSYPPVMRRVPPRYVAGPGRPGMGYGTTVRRGRLY